MSIATAKKINFTELANMIQKSKRNRRPPRVQSASLNHTDTGDCELTIKGENLAVQPGFEMVGVVNRELAKVVQHGPTEIKLSTSKTIVSEQENEVVIVLDPFSILRFQLTSKDT